MLNKLPNDPVMLLSVVNTKLRDQYSSIEQLCEDLNIEQNELVNKLDEIDYQYNKERNQFL